jgi:hypothetical protein
VCNKHASTNQLMQILLWAAFAAHSGISLDAVLVFDHQQLQAPSLTPASIPCHNHTSALLRMLLQLNTCRHNRALQVGRSSAGSSCTSSDASTQQQHCQAAAAIPLAAVASGPCNQHSTLRSSHYQH